MNHNLDQLSRGRPVWQCQEEGIMKARAAKIKTLGHPVSRDHAVKLVTVGSDLLRQHKCYSG